jgi:hypothetical protein
MYLAYHNLPISTESKVIRLLDIDSLGRDRQAPLTGHLRLANLDGNPIFTALSYAWGDKSETPLTISVSPGIDLQSYVLELTDNCYSALVQLRETLGSFTIWIDSICINQEDAIEKTHQISLMGDIYSSASTVYLWLGDGTPVTDRAMSFMASSPSFELFQNLGQPDSVSVLSWSNIRCLFKVCVASWSRDHGKMIFPLGKPGMSCSP